MMCTTRKHPKLKMTNFENVQRSSMLMSTSKEGAKAGTQEKWRARQALDFLAKLDGTHFSGWSWVRGETALLVKHLSQATCSETTYIQRGALHLGFTLEPDIVYNAKIYCQSEWVQWTYMALTECIRLIKGRQRQGCVRKRGRFRERNLCIWSCALQRGTTSELLPPNWSLEIRGGKLVAVYTYWYVWYMCDVCTWYCTTCALPLKDALQCFKLQLHVAYWSVRED